METVQKPLEHLKKGEGVYFQETKWYVSKREVFVESDSYQEIQWTLDAPGRNPHYLVRSEEKIDTHTEYVWIFTEATNINFVQFEPRPGYWESFNDESFVTTPPETVKFNQAIFTFDGVTSVVAEDDEGNRVTKLSWDYSDVATKKRNLCIEIWKEEDRDYPEAYDGIVVEPLDFKILDPEAVRNISLKPQKWTSWITSYVAIGIMFFLFGMPLDYFLSVSVPALLIVGMWTVYSPLWRIISFSIWLTMAIVFLLSGFSASFWLITSLSLIVTIFIPRLIASAVNEQDASNYPSLAFFGLLPVVWIYSFIIYFRYAPAPHTGNQLFVVCLLPIAITTVCYVVQSMITNHAKT